MSFSLKVILVLLLGPWKFWKLQMGPFSLPQSASLLSLTADSATPPAAALGRPRPSPTSPPLHVAPPRASGPNSPRAGAPSLRHAPAEASRGRHPDAAVASPLQHQGPPIRARFGTQSTVAFFSPHFFGRSPLRKPRTEPPPSASSPAKPRRGDTTSRLLYPKPNPLIEHSSSHEALKPV